MEPIVLEPVAHIKLKISIEDYNGLGECYAGNILKFDINNSCVITANMKDLPSYTNPYYGKYDELIYHFFSFIHDGYPDGKILRRKGENDVKKAFQYAVDMDIFSPNSLEGDKIRNMCHENYIEVPQMKCNIVGKIML